MNIYFFSPIFATVKTHNTSFTLKPYNPQAIIDADDDALVQIEPLGDYLPCFCHFGNTKSHKNMRVIDLLDGFLLIPEIKPTRNFPCEKVASITKNIFGTDVNFAVYQDGGHKLVLSSPYYHEEFELPFRPKKFEVFPLNNHIIIALKAKRTTILALSLPDFSTKLSLVCDHFKIDDYLSTTNVLNDIARHTVIDNWNLRDFTHMGRKLKQERKSFKSHELPYAFLQEVSLCGDYRSFLSEELVPRAHLLQNFLGQFDYVIPPFKPSQPDCLGLVHKSSMRFLTITFENKNIVDLNIREINS